MTLACVSSWGQAAIDDAAGPVRLVIRDELWRALRIPAMTRKIDSDLRLSRAHGTIQALATHRLADFEAAAAAGTAEAAIARALIASCDTRICLAQDTEPLAVTRDAIGLTDTECAHIASWSGEQLGPQPVEDRPRVQPHRPAHPDPGRTAPVLDQPAHEHGFRQARHPRRGAGPGEAS